MNCTGNTVKGLGPISSQEGMQKEAETNSTTVMEPWNSER